MTDEVLSWDDTGNNRFLASGRGAWIQNPISALRSIEKDNPELARKLAISNTPAGPKGRFASVAANILGIMRWSKNQAAARALRRRDSFGSYLEGVRASEGYNQPTCSSSARSRWPSSARTRGSTLLQDFAKTAGSPATRARPPRPRARSRRTGSSR